MGFLYWLSSRPVNLELFPHVDKVFHAGVYMGLVLVGYRTLRETLPGEPGSFSLGSLLLAALAAVVYGALDEWHQASVPTRQPSVTDWLADLFGASLAVTIVWVRHRLAARRRSTHATG